MEDHDKPPVNSMWIVLYDIFTASVFHLIKAIVYLGIVILLIVLSTTLHAKLVGIFTLFSGIIFDVISLLKLNPGKTTNEKRSKAITFSYLLYLIGIIMIIVLSFICYPQKIPFFLWVRSLPFIECMIDVIAFTGLVSPIMEYMYAYRAYNDSEYNDENNPECDEEQVPAES